MKYIIFTSFVGAICFIFGIFMKDKLFTIYRKFLDKAIKFYTKIKGE